MRVCAHVCKCVSVWVSATYMTVCLPAHLYSALRDLVMSFYCPYILLYHYCIFQALFALSLLNLVVYISLCKNYLLIICCVYYLSFVFLYFVSDLAYLAQGLQLTSSNPVNAGILTVSIIITVEWHCAVPAQINSIK